MTINKYRAWKAFQGCMEARHNNNYINTIPRANVQHPIECFFEIDTNKNYIFNCSSFLRHWHHFGTQDQYVFDATIRKQTLITHRNNDTSTNSWGNWRIGMGIDTNIIVFQQLYKLFPSKLQSQMILQSMFWRFLSNWHYIIMVSIYYFSYINWFTLKLNFINNLFR